MLTSIKRWLLVIALLTLALPPPSRRRATPRSTSTSKGSPALAATIPPAGIRPAAAGNQLPDENRDELENQGAAGAATAALAEETAPSVPSGEQAATGEGGGGDDGSAAAATIGSAPSDDPSASQPSAGRGSGGSLEAVAGIGAAEGGSAGIGLGFWIALIIVGGAAVAAVAWRRIHPSRQP